MLMSSPMADPGGGDVAMAAITDMTEGLTMTAPKSVFVSKRSRSTVTRRRSNIGLQRARPSPAYKCPTSEGRSIFDDDLSVPLHDRLMANRVKRLENWEGEKKTEMPPDSGYSVIVTEAVVHSVVACCLASNVLSPLSFMPVADEKFEEPTAAHCISDCGPMLARSRDDCSPTLAQCVGDCGPTRCSAHRGLELQTCREEKANEDCAGETAPGTATATLQAGLANWDPEACVKSTRKRNARQRCSADRGPTPARCSADCGPDSQTCREEKADPDCDGEIVPEDDATTDTMQADLADWDPEASVKSTRRKRGGRKRRDTGNFLMIHMNMATLDDDGLSTPEQTGFPSEGVRFKARRSRRLRRKSMRLQTVVPPVVAEQTVETPPVVTEETAENAVGGIDETTFVLSGSPSGGATCVAVTPEDRTVVSLCSPRQCDVTPPDSATADIANESNVAIDEPSVTIDEDISPVESISVIAPPQASRDSAWVSDRRPSRRCTQRARVVEVDSPSPPPKTPKKRGRKVKQGKKWSLVSLADIYNNRLWRSQMPETGKRWTTIAEESDSCSGHSRAAVSRTVVDKPRSLEVSDFYSKTRMAKRRQKARRQGWKPLRKKKLGEQTVIDELLESKLRALDDELMRDDH